MKQIVLASSSPRRKALLKQIGLSFIVDASNIEEKLNPRLKPRGNAEQLSLQKALAVAVNYKDKDVLLIAADTFVVFEGEILGKPENEKQARRMLTRMSGRQHIVITGFTIMDLENQKIVTESVETKVYFKKLTREEIHDYVRTGEPMDKAGAYGMQERGGMFVERIEGEPFNVVGLPLKALSEALKKFKIPLI